MFEYTALVDAPVKRFTSIVTDPEPGEAPVAVAIATPAIPVAMPVAEAPVLLIAAEPEADESEAVEPGPRTTQRRPAAARAVVARSQSGPGSTPSFVPALIGIAAAGITAFWWLRRDSHDR